MTGMRLQEISVLLSNGEKVEIHILEIASRSTESTIIYPKDEVTYCRGVDRQKAPYGSAYASFTWAMKQAKALASSKSANIISVNNHSGLILMHLDDQLIALNKLDITASLS